MSLHYKIKLSSSRMKFAAGHFTIFSATSRERIHGHNFTVSCTICTTIKQNDLVFDYAKFKNILANRCQSLDELMLLPDSSPYLSVIKNDKSVICDFNNEQMMFPLQDVYILPVENVTIEGLAEWFLLSFIDSIPPIELENICEVEIGVSSSPAQMGLAIWSR